MKDNWCFVYCYCLFNCCEADLDYDISVVLLDCLKAVFYIGLWSIKNEISKKIISK